MDCREFSHLISLHLDGEISKNEEAALAEHVAVCEGCAQELALQERISGVLRDLGREEIQAPRELCGLVMNKIRTERRGALLRLPAAWRKAVAAAAAVLLLAGGSAGVITGLKITGIEKVAGLESIAQKFNADTGVDVSTSEDPAGGSSIEPGDSRQITGITSIMGDSGGKSANDSTQGDENSTLDNSGIGTQKTSTGAKGTAGVVAAPAENETRVLLGNISMKATNTLLKMAVNDLNEGRIKAVSLAAGAGAATQVFPEQDGSKKIVVLRLTVNSDRANELIAGLSRLGTVINRQDESRDITSLYNETMVQYHDLQSRITLAQGTPEQQQLEAQAASYKQQLATWEAEAGKRIIMLWLQSI